MHCGGQLQSPRHVLLFFVAAAVVTFRADAQIVSSGQNNQGINQNQGINPRPVNIVSGPNSRGPFTSFGGVNQGASRFDWKNVDWTTVDRRFDVNPQFDNWRHLYPFGEKFFDTDSLGRPWNDQQIDLDFFFPYFGFRFNYTFIFPEGFIAFSYPHYIQPPYDFPAPRWPNEHDPSLIACFMSAQQKQFVGETGISHLWHRTIMRPIGLIGTDVDVYASRQNLAGTGGSLTQVVGPSRYNRMYQGLQLHTVDGRVEDPEMLDQITRDIREGMVGARGFTADYALVVTWERMSYGGSPKITNLNQFHEALSWQNTYQLVIATDEIRSYVMFNFANINWTSSTSAGAQSGRGGKQSALVGFNGGNGTGFINNPYSAEGNSYKLVQFGSTQTAGRWMYRVDEEIIYGGCTNDSTGVLRMSKIYSNMLGGFSLNVSGPCFRHGDVVKLQLDELTLDCQKLDRVIARCIVPVNQIWRTGLVPAKLSQDGGKNYPWWTTFYILQPGLARQHVNLINDPLDPNNNWRSYNPSNLSLNWPSGNLSADHNAKVDINLFGYWEDVEGHSLVKIGSLVEDHTNNGEYTFDPRQIRNRHVLAQNAWKWYYGGVLQVTVSDNKWMEDKGDGMYWSRPVPFGWYFHQQWEYEYGKNWALEICQEWFDYDGRRGNFIMELEPKIPCPCTLSQALVDMGRYTAKQDCDMFGNSECYETRGARHCVVSTVSVWTGAGQQCCYDQQGWLMFSDDYEYNAQYLRFYSAGVPYRAHPWGSFPYKRPPYVPTMSNFYNDILPYEYCCKWAGHCEFYFWRRQTSTCQQYRPPAVAYAYGDPHFITFDNAKYSFQGKGYYVLSMMKSSRHDLMVQARFEQPPKTLWNAEVPATIMTGVAARDNKSDVVQVFSRKDFRQWRYKTDVYVNGIRIFFDTPWQKVQTFQGVTIRSPPRNMNMSELDIMFTTGVGVRVQEARGMLNVMVSLPHYYNASYSLEMERLWSEGLSGGGAGLFDDSEEARRRALEIEQEQMRSRGGGAYGSNCHSHRTLGLLGTFDGIRDNDLTTPDCTQVTYREDTSMSFQNDIYNNFGNKWRVDAQNGVDMLFQVEHLPINDPRAFANDNYFPQTFDWANIQQQWQLNATRWRYEDLIFTPEQVQTTCQGVHTCMYDYFVTGRKEIAIDTLEAEKKFLGLKQQGEQKLISCGPLWKERGVIKQPPGNNYLDGVTVTFTCKPEYFLHGDQQRTCINGRWTPGWFVWCRKRGEEIALKWIVGVLSFFGILLVILLIFGWCWFVGKQRRKYEGSTMGGSAYRGNTGPLQRDPPPKIDHYGSQHDKLSGKMISVLDNEPPKVGMMPMGGGGGGSRSGMRTPNGFSETSA